MPDSVLKNITLIVVRWGQQIEKQTAYRPKELEKLFRLSMRAAAGPLTLLGWTRIRQREAINGKRVLRTVWYPPGAAPPPRPRGRPRFDLIAIFGTHS